MLLVREKKYACVEDHERFLNLEKWECRPEATYYVGDSDERIYLFLIEVAGNRILAFKKFGGRGPLIMHTHKCDVVIKLHNLTGKVTSVQSI